MKWVEVTTAVALWAIPSLRTAAAPPPSLWKPLDHTTSFVASLAIAGVAWRFLWQWLKHQPLPPLQGPAHPHRMVIQQPPPPQAPHPQAPHPEPPPPQPIHLQGPVSLRLWQPCRLLLCLLFWYWECSQVGGSALCFFCFRLYWDFYCYLNTFICNLEEIDIHQIYICDSLCTNKWIIDDENQREN